MSATKKKKIRVRRRNALQFPKVEIVIVSRSKVRGTLFPEKLRKVNEMLKHAKLMD